jgi:Uma2 family endonuclease
MTLTERLLTAADLAELPTLLPSGSVRYELREGALRIMSPQSDVHAVVEARIGGVLVVQGEWQGHGQARSGGGGILLGRDPDTVLGADAGFLTNDQLPARRSREGYLETIPALVAEVLPKNDRPGRVAEKVSDYLAAGVRVVWVVDPRQRNVTVHRAGDAPVVLGEADTLTAEGIIPGLAYPVGRLFEGLD